MDINLYTLIAVIIVAILVFILFILFLRSNKSFSISKDGITLYTKQGNFVNKEVSDAEKIELLRTTERICEIEHIEILNDQMCYIERELSRYYKENLDKLKDMTGLGPKDELYQQYQIIYMLHKEKMSKQIKKILKENHLCDKADWPSYKNRQFEYTWGKAMEYLDNYFGIIEVDRRKIITEQAREAMRNDYKMRFFDWMDEFKKISSEKILQIRELKDRQDKLISGVKLY